MLRHVVILLVAVGLAVGVTGPKLYRMAQIKGWLRGATVEERVVTQKWHQTPDQHPRGRNTYWIALSGEDIRKVGPHRTNVTAETWQDLEVGDTIEVIRVPGDPEPYLRDDIFVSQGNFLFDLALLAAEVGVAGVMVWLLWRRSSPPR